MTQAEPFYLPPRDFVGYGLEQPTGRWPGGAVLAVSFVLNYEEGGEHTVYNGDDKSNNVMLETSYDRTEKHGKRDCVAEDVFDYGIRAGFPRLIKLFRKYGWHWTTWATGRAFETSVDYPKLMVAEGHEVACHGNRWRNHGQTTAEEKAHVARSMDILQATTGRSDVPAGWFVGSGTERQKLVRALVHRERGVPLLYCSDAVAADTPYWIPDPAAAVYGGADEGMLMVPYSFTTNDVRFVVPNGAGFSAPDDFFDLLKGEFDQLYAEGQDGALKMMNVCMHNRVLGKPGRIMALKRFMAYIADKPGVWVATRREIAEFWREKYPYAEVGPTYKLHA